MKLKYLIAMLNLKLRGHYLYYGIIHNYIGIHRFYDEVRRKLYKWLRRRGDKTKWNWNSVVKLTEEWQPLVKPYISKPYVQT